MAKATINSDLFFNTGKLIFFILYSRTISTTLTHAESGQWQSSLTVIPLPKSDPQGMGSAITYARKYALTSMLGMITENDEAEAAKMPTQKPKSNKLVQNTRPTGSRKVQTSPNEPPYETTPDTLPNLEGVSYKYTTAQDGRQCIVATGNTQKC